jgi:predicted dehydrogenase
MGRWHAHAAARAGATVAAIVDPNGDRAAQLSARHPGSRVLEGLDASSIGRDITIAHVCTPLSTHAGIVAPLIDAGVHVLAEKPLTGDARSTAALLESAQGRGVLLCPVHQMPFQRGVQSLIAEIEALGELLHVEFSACTAGAVGKGDADQDSLVDDILPHPLSVFRRLVAADMASLDWQVRRPRAGEFRAFATVGPRVVSISVSTHGRPTSNSLRVVGERATASVDLYHGFVVVHGGRVSRAGKILRPFLDAAGTAAAAARNLATRVVTVEPAYPGLATLVRAFYAATNGEVAVPISSEETLDIARARDLLRAAGS